MKVKGVKHVRAVTPDYEIRKPTENAMLNPHPVSNRVDRIPGNESAVDSPRHFPANTPDMFRAKTRGDQMVSRGKKT